VRRAEQDKDVTVAVISQNDDLGKAFVNGFTSGISGSKVKIVAQETYEATDPTLDSQVAKLAASKADVLFSAIAIPKLTAGALSKAAELGWNPEHLLVSLVSSGLTRRAGGGPPRVGRLRQIAVSVRARAGRGGRGARRRRRTAWRRSGPA
jgi:branched-chain amino acid transport system substrate-binding protein